MKKLVLFAAIIALCATGTKILAQTTVSSSGMFVTFTASNGTKTVHFVCPGDAPIITQSANFWASTLSLTDAQKTTYIDLLAHYSIFKCANPKTASVLGISTNFDAASVQTSMDHFCSTFTTAQISAYRIVALQGIAIYIIKIVCGTCCLKTDHAIIRWTTCPGQWIDKRKIKGIVINIVRPAIVC